MQKDRIVEVFQTKHLDKNNEMIVVDNIDKTEITYNNGEKLVITSLSEEEILIKGIFKGINFLSE